MKLTAGIAAIVLCLSCFPFASATSSLAYFNQGNDILAIRALIPGVIVELSCAGALRHLEFLLLTMTANDAKSMCNAALILHQKLTATIEAVRIGITSELFQLFQLLINHLYTCIDCGVKRSDTMEGVKKHCPAVLPKCEVNILLEMASGELTDRFAFGRIVMKLLNAAGDILPCLAVMGYLACAITRYTYPCFI